jgi:hypothetical protein
LKQSLKEILKAQLIARSFFGNVWQVSSHRPER